MSFVTVGSQRKQYDQLGGGCSPAHGCLSRIRFRGKSSFALPKHWRLRCFILTVPSVGPLLHGTVNPAVTAAKSCSRPATNECSAGRSSACRFRGHPNHVSRTGSMWCGLCCAWFGAGELHDVEVAAAEVVGALGQIADVGVVGVLPGEFDSPVVVLVQ